VLCHPEIYEVIGGDGKPPIDEYEPPMQGAIYLVGYVEDNPMACMIYHQDNQWCWWCHVQVLPAYRDEYAKEFGEKVLDWAFTNIPKCRKINAQIPTCYPNVIKFAQLFGFEIEGLNQDSYLKDGVLHPQYYMGISRWDG
jgi:RimJ/RimL family protein N-acetyltransferase